MVIMINVLNLIAECFVGGMALILFIYIATRAASFAWYQGKWEHFKKVWQLQEESNNGDD